MNALVPFAEVKEMASAAARSGLFPGAKTPETALALMMLAQAEGLHPMQALRRFHVIEGQPSMKADAMLASFQAAGGRVTWRRSDDHECRAVFEAPGVGAPFEVAWTMDDAKRAGVGGKRNWAQYPRQMLRARVISEGVRATMPGVCMGIYTPEEVADFDPRPAPAPTPAPVAVPAAPAAPVIDAEAAPVPQPRASKSTISALKAALLARFPDNGSSKANARKGYVADAIGDDVGSLSDLTEAEAAVVLERLAEDARAADAEVAL